MFDNISSNLFAQAQMIIYSIAEQYELGSIDDPSANHLLLQLFALVGEGKVIGSTCEDTGRVKWTLTEAYEEQLEKAREAAMTDGTVVPGPW